MKRYLFSILSVLILIGTVLSAFYFSNNQNINLTTQIITYNALIALFIANQYIQFRSLSQIEQQTIKVIKHILSIGKKVKKKELRSISLPLKALTKEYDSLTKDQLFFLNELEKGTQTEKLSLKNKKHPLSQALLSLKKALINKEKKLIDKATLENKKQWAETNKAQIGNILREESNRLDVLSEKVLQHLVSSTDFNFGCIYLKDNEETMTSVATYAMERSRSFGTKITKNEGTTGAVWLEKKPIWIRNLPKNYLSSNLSFGSLTVKEAVIIPLLYDQEVVGIMELISLDTLNKELFQFICSLSELLGSSIYITQNNIKTKELLRQSQSYAETMRTQDEEMRQNLEELEATQEEMKRKEAVLTETLQKLEHGKAIGTIRELELTFLQQLQNIKSDLLFLSRIPPIPGIIRASYNNGFDEQGNSSHELWVKRLRTIFDAMTATKENYKHIVFFNNKHEKMGHVSSLKDDSFMFSSNCLSKTTNSNEGAFIVGKIHNIDERKQIEVFTPVYFKGKLWGILAVLSCMKQFTDLVDSKKDNEGSFELIYDQQPVLLPSESHSTKNIDKTIEYNKDLNLSIHITHYISSDKSLTIV